MFAHYYCSLSTLLSYMWIFNTGRIIRMLVVNISPLYFNVYNNYHTKHLVDINKISAIVFVKPMVNIKSILLYSYTNTNINIGLDIFISRFIQQCQVLNTIWVLALMSFRLCCYFFLSREEEEIKWSCYKLIS